MLQVSGSHANSVFRVWLWKKTPSEANMFWARGDVSTQLGEESQRHIAKLTLRGKKAFADWPLALKAGARAILLLWLSF